MTTISPEKRDQFRAELTTDASIQDALKTIEECDWDLESAAMVIAMREGQQVSVDRSPSEFIEKLLEQSRDVVCQDAFKGQLVPGLITVAITSLATSMGFSAALATPLVLYLIAVGADNFCKSK